MSMGNDRTLSAEDQAALASTLVDLAVIQQDKCKALLGEFETALNAFDCRTTELTRDMPDKIARQAAQKVVADIADFVTRKLEKVLQPAEQRAQNLLRAMDKAVAEYQRAARKAVATCIIYGCTSGLASAVLVVLAMKMLGIVAGRP
jgi:hypothetical protein